MTDRYPPEPIVTDKYSTGYARPDDEYISDDDGTMPENLAELSAAVVGHRIIKAEQGSAEVPCKWTRRQQKESGLIITLDNGHQVMLVDTYDCCAKTQLESFLLHPELVDHVILGVGTTDGFEKWHIYADLGDVLELTVDWSAGNPFYYGYGFDIYVTPIAEDTTSE